VSTDKRTQQRTKQWLLTCGIADSGMQGVALHGALVRRVFSFEVTLHTRPVGHIMTTLTCRPHREFVSRGSLVLYSLWVHSLYISLSQSQMTNRVTGPLMGRKCNPTELPHAFCCSYIPSGYEWTRGRLTQTHRYEKNTLKSLVRWTHGVQCQFMLVFI